MQSPQKVLEEINARVLTACQRAGRSADSVTLIGAGKTVEAARVLAFARAGLSNVGENYLQEALGKQRTLESENLPLRWHFIGSLQSNKARDAVGKFVLIHSVDRLSLARALQKKLEKRGATQDILLQVNIGEESSKSGCAPDELPQLLQACRELSQLRVLGLTCLPPFDENAENTRPFFQKMRELARDNFEKNALLSMGMSNNYEVAIEEGATHIRIGTALFGARPES